MPVTVTEIEPWTFQQHVGQAVIIPTGCPYQIMNTKVLCVSIKILSLASLKSRNLCCVHAVLEFVSPENVTEGFQLIDEVRLLPEDHIANDTGCFSYDPFDQQMIVSNMILIPPKQILVESSVE
ncbi:Lysine-specific demethylase JMJ25, partial [Mucuna pruriens]